MLAERWPAPEIERRSLVACADALPAGVEAVAAGVVVTAGADVTAGALGAAGAAAKDPVAKDPVAKDPAPDPAAKDPDADPEVAAAGKGTSNQNVLPTPG